MMSSSIPMTSEIEDELRALGVAEAGDGDAEMPKLLPGGSGEGDAAVSLLLFPMFTQPAKRDDFLHKMDETHVCLERVSAEWSGHRTARFEGAVIVNNLEFEKRVAVKYTADGWKTQSCCEAAFSGRVDRSGLRQLLSDGNVERDWDRFHFCFDVSDVVESTKVAFYVEYATSSHGQKWDNNGGSDYGFVIQAVGLLSALTCIASGVAQTCIASDVGGRCDGGLDCPWTPMDCRCQVNEDDGYYYDEDEKEISSYASSASSTVASFTATTDSDADSSRTYCEVTDCSICDSTYNTTFSNSTITSTSGTESYHSGSEDEEETSIEDFGQDEIEATIDSMLDEVSKKLEDAKISDSSEEDGGGVAKSPLDVKHVEITYNCGDLPAAKVRPGPGPAPLLIDLTASDDEDHSKISRS